MWKNIEEWGMPHMTLWRMPIAFWLPIAINKHTGCVMFITFLLQQWLREPASVLLYTYIACLVLYMISLCHALI